MKQATAKNIATAAATTTTEAFVQNEKVLCYEPDISKARVVYDAKILKISPPLHDKASSKKAKVDNVRHYLVHFQGWSSTWDRFVPEEFLLKDNPQNRQLQKQLFDEAEEIRRMLKKKKKKKRSDSAVSDAGSSSAVSNSNLVDVKLEPADDEEDPVEEMTGQQQLTIDPDQMKSDCSSSSTVSPSSASALNHILAFNKAESSNPRRSSRQNSLINPDPESSTNLPAVRMRDSLKRTLKQDESYVTKKHRLTRLPANPNIASVLEDFVRHYAASRLVLYEKQLSKTYYTAYRKESSRELYQKALDAINIAKEVAEGLRIAFDFNLANCLLYGHHGEGQQFEKAMKFEPKKIEEKKQKNIVVVVNHGRGCGSSNTSSTSGGGRSTPTLLNPPASGPSTPQAMGILRSLQSWKLVPVEMYQKEEKVMPSMVYGPVHLLRLFVKMPEILAKMRMPGKTTKLIVKYMDDVLEYLNGHPDLFNAEEVYE